MKTWLIVIVGLLLLSQDQSNAKKWHWQDGVIIQKTGSGYLYLFPHNQGRIKARENPAGVISVGETITVMYSLRLIGHAKARFIALDATRANGISPNLTVTKSDDAFGFFVRDTNQSQLDIIIDSSFMKKLRKSASENTRQTVAYLGNLNVILTEKNGHIVIERVTLD